MAVEKKRIGLTLASIHTGVSRNMWAGFVRAAIAENTSLYIFPGGKLNARQDFENLRNPVYYLANEENLDGCISWSSSIRYAQSQEEFEPFHSGFDPLPYVTLGIKSPGHPCVDFDAYNGMKALVNHFITVHGSRKIAFLRGPNFHRSAAARFEGYNDALKEAGLSTGASSPLVTDPFSWEAGEAAAAQLYEQRSLVPGVDFDTLIGSSDLMALKAINYFEKRNFNVPVNYHAAGFNNSAESRITESLLSTVRLPYDEMSRESFKILLGNMGRKKRKGDADVLLQCEVITRESCGCVYQKGGQSLSDIEEILINTAENDDINNTFKSVIHAFLREKHETERWNSRLNSLKCDLLGTRDRFSLVQNLAQHLPEIGINTAAIVLYSDDKTSIFVGGFSAEGINPLKDQRFPSRLLVPPPLKSLYSDGIFMIQPLFIDNQSLGYFIHNVPITNGVIYEELRSAVSYALKGIFLLEETFQAKRIAEQAESAKTEIFMFLENGLFNPLKEVTDRLELIEKKAAGKDYKTLQDDLKEIKTFISSKEAEAGSIMDFTLAKVDEFSLRKTVFDPEEILPKIGTFPLLIGDTARLIQCFSIIREQYNDSLCSAELTFAGLSVTFKNKTNKVKSVKQGIDEKARQFGLLLAERIILLHGGFFKASQDRCNITLPWPTLTGAELSKNPVGSQDRVFVLSDPDSLPANFLSLPQVWDVEKAQSGKTAFIVWNANGAAPEDLIKVAGLKNKNEFAGIPFLCYGVPPGVRGSMDSAESLIDIIDYSLKSPKNGTILFIGSKTHDFSEQLLDSMSDTLNKIHIDSMSVFNITVGEVSPQLIVFNSLDISGIAAVRQHPLTVMVPVVMVSDRIDNTADVTALSQYSRLIICHRAAVLSPEFKARIQAIIGGADFLPPHTGVLVKKAILYFGMYAESHISRWKLADSVNVSEDYLTRIFHREMGLSLWDYLSRLRIFLAADLLRRTDDTIQDIAYRTGFQDHAYFCRVFKKIYGIPPGQLRKRPLTK